MKRHFPRGPCGLAVLLAAFLFTTWGYAETAKLELKKIAKPSGGAAIETDNQFLYRYVYSQYMGVQGGRSVGQETAPDFTAVVKKEPAKYDSQKPFKGMVKLGGENYGFVLDTSDLKSKGFEKLYFDRNHNGDLTDDGVISADPLPANMESNLNNVNREFPRMDLTLKADGKEYEYAFFMRVYTYWNPGPSGSDNDSNMQGTVMFQSAAYREGDLEIGGKKHHVVLLDYNSDGRFDSQYSINEPVSKMADRIMTNYGDMLILDPDLSNKDFRGYEAIQRKEKQPVSRLVGVDGQFYELKITPSGDSMTLTPSTVALGSVANPNPNYSAVVYGDKGFVRINGDKNKAVSLPEGMWTLLEYKIDASDPSAKTSTSGPSQGRKPTTLVVATATKDCKPVKVTQGKTAEFPFGQPYKPVVTCYPMMTGPGIIGGGGNEANQSAQLNMRLIGVAGETCTSLEVNGDRPDAPTFVISTAGNEIVERGKFEYG